MLWNVTFKYWETSAQVVRIVNTLDKNVGATASFACRSETILRCQIKKKSKEYKKYYMLGILTMVLLNSCFGTLFVLTKIRDYDTMATNLVQLSLCVLNGVFMLVMAFMLLSGVNTIQRIAKLNAKDPNYFTFKLHLIMIFSAFIGCSAVWTLYGIARYM